MYLCSSLLDSKYVRFQYKLIPQEIINHYHLNNKVVDGYVYAQIKKAWYGLSESDRIAHDDLVNHLKNMDMSKPTQLDFSATSLVISHLLLLSMTLV